MKLAISDGGRPALWLLIILLGLSGCSAGRNETVEPTREPAATPEERGQAPARSDERPTADGDAAAREPATADVPAEPEPRQPPPETPPFLRILERIDTDRNAALSADASWPSELRITSDNVQRFAITRENLPLARDSSVILRLDGQNMEWTARYSALELARSRSGLWEVVKRVPAEP